MDREKILANIRQHNRGLTSDDLLRSNESSAGLTPNPPQTTEDQIKSFSKMVKSVGGECIDIRGQDLGLRVQDENNSTPNAKNSSLFTLHSSLEIMDFRPYFGGTKPQLLHAHFGVAENGACWIVHHLDDDRTRYTLPEHIAIILSAEDIVPTMHEAYERIAEIGIEDLGIFLSGPSKTADIEQSLVLGAQGAITTKVFLV